MKRANVAEVIEALHQKSRVLRQALQGVAGEAQTSIVNAEDLNALYDVAAEVEALAGRLQGLTESRVRVA